MRSLAKTIARGAAHAVLTPLEVRMLARQPVAQWPHIFILGAPRSGTSLFYELMVTRFEFAYFSNLAHRFYKTPLTATRIGRWLIARHTPVYQSDYGHISGWAAPNEGGWIWQRWLKDGPWTDERILPSLPVAEIRATLAGMSMLGRAPFINKNVMHSNRVRLLDALFPGCLFLEVRRDASDTARSIIRAQRRNKGHKRDYEGWWSVRPSNAGGDTDIERACRQVTGVAQDIESDCAHIGADRHFKVNYETLCANPEHVMSDVALFLYRHDIQVAQRPHSPVPDSFTLRTPQPLAEKEELILERMLQPYSKMAER